MPMSVPFYLMLLAAVQGKVWISLFQFNLSLPVCREVTITRALNVDKQGELTASQLV